MLQDEEFEGGPKTANKDDVWAVKKAYMQAHMIAVECWISEISNGAGSLSGECIDSLISDSNTLHESN